ncbi:MAG: GNAT family N-acetyltransferase [Candidatus Faecousia sp.]|nr:GNAT family N-acetyltransferase [Candidatus Faecousia sp.]
MLIRKAVKSDLSRIAEIFVFNNRINYFPIFKQEEFSFGKLQVVSLIDSYFGKEEILNSLFVAEENGILKGFLELRETEIVKLYVEPCFQSGGIGHGLMEYATQTLHAEFLWALEKNTRARAFYHRHGFLENGERELEEGTTEYLLKLVRRS